MNFWIKNIVFGGLLIGLATYLFLEQEAIMDFVDSAEQFQDDVIQSTKENTASNEKVIEEPTQHRKKNIESDNAAAKGLSRFYANLHGEFGEEAKIRNNVVFLPEPNGNLEEILTAKAMVTRPLKPTWRGRTESRPFRKGQTLFQKLTEYAEDEGLDVIWWLNRDLIIKDPFRINKEMLYTAYMIGNAVQGHFPNGVTSYFCYKQRAIVLVEHDLEYLQEECSVLDPENLKRTNRRY